MGVMTLWAAYGEGQSKESDKGNEDGVDFMMMIDGRGVWCCFPRYTLDPCAAGLSLWSVSLWGKCWEGADIYIYIYTAVPAEEMSQGNKTLSKDFALFLPPNAFEQPWMFETVYALGEAASRLCAIV
jgi:hypothetical protein